MSELDNFVAWLTTRKETLTVGASVPVYGIQEALDEWKQKAGVKPARRPEFAQRGLGGEKLCEHGFAAWQVCSACKRLTKDDEGKGMAAHFPLHGAAAFAPELDALACERCARALVDGEDELCADCHKHAIAV